MEKITTAAQLKSEIQDLEYKQACEWILLKEQFQVAYQGLKPINIIKSKLKELILAPDFKTNALNSAIGFTAGVVAKKVLIGKTHNPFMKLLGFAIEMVVTNKVTKNPDGIKSIAGILFKKLLSKQNNSENI
ncbi:MAG TPA: hypothetical protein VNZ49_09675 [Bacteroidia bacterium]|jgi:hypothetical protein|nr:hypothetical protein [Bacteroidia bacterium]